jgi:hypothetical protein
LKICYTSWWKLIFVTESMNSSLLFSSFGSPLLMVNLEAELGVKPYPKPSCCRSVIANTDFTNTDYFVGILSLSKKYTRLVRGQRGTIMPNGDKTFLFVLYICSAEGALSYKKSLFYKSRKSIKYIILHIFLVAALWKAFFFDKSTASVFPGQTMLRFLWPTLVLAQHNVLVYPLLRRHSLLSLPM